MSRLTRDAPVEPVSRDEILRRERGQENNNFPCSRIGNITRLILTLLLYVMTINTKYSNVVPTSTVSYYKKKLLLFLLFIALGVLVRNPV